MDNANQKLGQSSRRTFNHVFWQTFRLINKTTISLWDSGYLCKLEFVRLTSDLMLYQVSLYDQISVKEPDVEIPQY